jgi:hypothetical protein
MVVIFKGGDRLNLPGYSRAAEWLRMCDKKIPSASLNSLRKNRPMHFQMIEKFVCFGVKNRRYPHGDNGLGLCPTKKCLKTLIFNHF